MNRITQELTRGTNNWSLSEVVHAIVLLSHFHSLSSFVFSCGLTQELENTSSQNNRSTVPQQQQVEKTEEAAQLPQIPEIIEVSLPLSSSPKSKLKIIIVGRADVMVIEGSERLDRYERFLRQSFNSNFF